MASAAARALDLSASTGPRVDTASAASPSPAGHLCRIPARHNPQHIPCRFCSCGSHKRHPRGARPLLAACPDAPAAGAAPKVRDKPLTEVGHRFAGESSAKAAYTAPPPRRRSGPAAVSPAPAAASPAPDAARALVSPEPAAAAGSADGGSSAPRRPTRWEELRGPRQEVSRGRLTPFGAELDDASSEYKREYVGKTAPRTLRHGACPATLIAKDGSPVLRPARGAASPDPALNSTVGSQLSRRPPSGSWGRRTPFRRDDNLGATRLSFDATSEYERHFTEKPLPERGPAPRRAPLPPAPASDWVSTAKASFRAPAESAACPCAQQPHVVSRPVST
eukprot:TRINITY_DN6053_c3_g4_i1.p1 TRINITY_DN6053_c3_g4~~TRINITY_DN6053_c3_g4_i1.p1  ORF type:complete len:336 (+),score=62.85 TRINITY_DN6053_c3_g4_i1:80-1087(+)